jgi:hypothetical protein
MATVQTNPIKEAERYLENAREILSEKAGKNGTLYTDPKYVKMAGDIAWKGVLLALDSTTDVRKGQKKEARVSIDDYLNSVAKKDKKMPKYLLTTYQLLHLYIGYDGILDYKTVQQGLTYGKNMIKWASNLYKV